MAGLIDREAAGIVALQGRLPYTITVSDAAGNKVEQQVIPLPAFSDIFPIAWAQSFSVPGQWIYNPVFLCGAGIRTLDLLSKQNM